MTVVLSALDEHRMFYLAFVMLVFPCRKCFPGARVLGEGGAEGGVPVEGMNGSRIGVVVFREVLKGLQTLAGKTCSFSKSGFCRACQTFLLKNVADGDGDGSTALPLTV